MNKIFTSLSFSTIVLEKYSYDSLSFVIPIIIIKVLIE